MTHDLTRGNILKTLLMVSIPTMIGFSAQMIYDIVDIFWLGRISGQAIAGVTVFSTIFWIVESLNEVIGVSSISLISQAFGKKDIPGTNRAIEQTITFKFIVAHHGVLHRCRCHIHGAGIRIPSSLLSAHYVFLIFSEYGFTLYR